MLLRHSIMLMPYFSHCAGDSQWAGEGRGIITVSGI